MDLKILLVGFFPQETFGDRGTKSRKANVGLTADRQPSRSRSDDYF